MGNRTQIEEEPRYNYTISVFASDPGTWLTLTQGPSSPRYIMVVGSVTQITRLRARSNSLSTYTLAVIVGVVIFSSIDAIGDEMGA